jgi:hypothetical protein
LRESRQLGDLWPIELEGVGLCFIELFGFSSAGLSRLPRQYFSYFDSLHSFLPPRWCCLFLESPRFVSNAWTERLCDILASTKGMTLKHFTSPCSQLSQNDQCLWHCGLEIHMRNSGISKQSHASDKLGHISSYAWREWRHQWCCPHRQPAFDPSFRFLVLSWSSIQLLRTCMEVRRCDCSCGNFISMTVLACLSRMAECVSTRTEMRTTN